MPVIGSGHDNNVEILVITSVPEIANERRAIPVPPLKFINPIATNRLIDVADEGDAAGRMLRERICKRPAAAGNATDHDVEAVFPGRRRLPSKRRATAHAESPGIAV